MKKTHHAATAFLAALSLALLPGCAFVQRHHPVPRYEIPDAPAPATEATPANAGDGEAVAVGKVRAAPEAAGRILRAVDVATGRSAPVAGWELATPAEAIVAGRLRERLSAERPGALVFDASMAPRGKAAALVECWIETFRVEKREGGWFFAFKADLFETAADGKTAGRRVAAETKIADPGREPPPEKVVRAIAETLQGL